MEHTDRHEALEATMRRVKLLVIKAKLASSPAARRRYLDSVCSELKKFLTDG